VTIPRAVSGPVRRVIVVTLLWLIRGYQLLVSPLLGPRCRFLPSCSEYATEAITAHGLLRGSALAVRRLLRCHPLGGSGYDPVPVADPAPVDGVTDSRSPGMRP